MLMSLMLRMTCTDAGVVTLHVPRGLVSVQFAPGAGGVETAMSSDEPFTMDAQPVSAVPRSATAASERSIITLPLHWFDDLEDSYLGRAPISLRSTANFRARCEPGVARGGSRNRDKFALMPQREVPEASGNVLQAREKMRCEHRVTCQRVPAARLRSQCQASQVGFRLQS